MDIDAAFSVLEAVQRGYEVTIKPHTQDGKAGFAVMTSKDGESFGIRYDGFAVDNLSKSLTSLKSVWEEKG